MDTNLKTLRQVCTMTGATRRALQHYDDIKLLPCPRKGKNTMWLYDEESILRLREILILRECELTLEEIRGVLDLPEKEKRKVFREKLKVLRKKREELDQKILFLESVAGYDLYSGFLRLMEYIKPGDFPEVLSVIEDRSELLTYSANRMGSFLFDTQEPFRTERNGLFRRIGKLQGNPCDSQEVQDAVAELQRSVSDRFGCCSGIDLLFLGGGLAANPGRAARTYRLKRDRVDYIIRVLSENGERISADEPGILDGEKWERGFEEFLSVLETVAEDSDRYESLPEDAGPKEVFGLIDVSDPRIQAEVRKLDRWIAAHFAFLDVGCTWGIFRFIINNPDITGFRWDEADEDVMEMGRFIDRIVEEYISEK